MVLYLVTIKQLARLNQLGTCNTARLGFKQLTVFMSQIKRLRTSQYLGKQKSCTVGPSWPIRLEPHNPVPESVPHPIVVRERERQSRVNFLALGSSIAM